MTIEYKAGNNRTACDCSVTSADKSKQVAMHEAGHVLYAVRAGAVSVVFHGAKEIDGMKGRAFVQGIYGRPVGSVEVALYFAAGGIAGRVLASDPTSGDRWDLVQFVKTVTAQSPNAPPGQIEQFWMLAQQQVEEHLAYPAVGPLMHALADRVELRIEDANQSPQLKVSCPASELIEIPVILQLLDGQPKHN
jgi:hypothetical protein